VKDTMTRLRIFRPEEFLHTPDNWPRNIGLVFVKKGDDLIGIEPCHRTEAPREIVFRIAGLLNLDFPSVHVAPRVEGWPHEGFSEESDRQFSAELGLILNHDKDLAEKAEDFGINFEFARERGISLAEVLPGGGERSDREVRFPPGFVSLAQHEPRGLVEDATIEFRDDVVILGLADDGETLSPKKEEIAISTDGRQVALPADMLIREGGLARLVLPDDAFSAYGTRREDLDPVITLHSDWMFISLRESGLMARDEGIWPAEEVSAPVVVENHVNAGKSRLGKAVAIVSTIILVTMLMMAGAAAIIGQDEILARIGIALQTEQDPVQSIRSDMFR